MSKESREDPDGKGYIIQAMRQETQKNNNVQISQFPPVHQILACQLS